MLAELSNCAPCCQVEARDRLLGGNIGLSTKNNEISCAPLCPLCRMPRLWASSGCVLTRGATSRADTKTYEVQGLSLGVSALYNYNSHTYVAEPACTRAKQ